MDRKEIYRQNRKKKIESDPEYAARMKEISRSRYRDNPEYAKEQKLKAKLRREKMKAENPELLAAKEKEKRDKIIASGKNRDYSANYNAKKRNAYIESVNFKVVFERDKGRCHICNAKTVRKYIGDKRPSNYATLDHVVPLNKGGLHCYDNVKIACSVCNSTKQDNIPDEGIQMNLFAQPGVTQKKEKESIAHLPEAERKKIYQARYHEKYREEINKRTRERRAANKEKGISEKRPSKEKGVEYSKAYRERHGDEINARRAKNRAAKRLEQLNKTQ